VAEPITPGGAGWAEALALRNRTRARLLALTGEVDLA